MQVQAPTALQIPECVKCSRASSAIAPQPNQPVALVRCGACDCEQRVYVHDHPLGYPDLHEQAVAKQGFKPSRHLSMQRSSAVGRLIEKLGKLSASWADERRLSPRLGVALTVTITPLDESYLPVGNAHNAATIDLSLSGMAFVSPTNEHACFWLVDFSPAGHRGRQSIIKPVRVAPLGTSMWKIAGPLLSVYDEPREPGGRLIHSGRRM